jgi:hypothetical protein
MEEWEVAQKSPDTICQIFNKVNFIELKKRKSRGYLCFNS